MTDRAPRPEGMSDRVRAWTQAAVDCGYPLTCPIGCTPERDNDGTMATLGDVRGLWEDGYRKGAEDCAGSVAKIDAMEKEIARLNMIIVKDTERMRAYAAEVLTLIAERDAFAQGENRLLTALANARADGATLRERVQLVIDDIERTWPDVRIHGPNTDRYGYGLREAARRVSEMLASAPKEPTPNDRG